MKSQKVVDRHMANHKYGCTIVLNHLKKFTGIFTTTDGMRVLGELLLAETPPDLSLFRIERLISIVPAWKS